MHALIYCVTFCDCDIHVSFNFICLFPYSGMHLRNTKDLFISQTHTWHSHHSSLSALSARLGCRQHQVHPSSPGGMRHGTGEQRSGYWSSFRAPNSSMAIPFIDKNLWGCLAICPWFFVVRNSVSDKSQITKKQPTGHAIVRVLSWLTWRTDPSLGGLIIDVKALVCFERGSWLVSNKNQKHSTFWQKNPNFCTDCFCPLGCSIPMRPQMDFLAENRATHLEESLPVLLPHGNTQNATVRHPVWHILPSQQVLMKFLLMAPFLWKTKSRRLESRGNRGYSPGWPHLTNSIHDRLEVRLGAKLGSSIGNLWTFDGCQLE